MSAQTQAGTYKNNAVNLIYPKMLGIPYFWTAVGLHILLGFLVSSSPIFATLHAVTCLVLGIFWAISAKHRHLLLYLCIYIIGSEVIWRMTDATVFWEFGKYAISLVLLLAILSNASIKIPRILFLYILFLTPSILLTLFNSDLSTARGQISFNLSGHLVLIVVAWYFYTIKLSQQQQTILVIILIPVVTIATIALYRMATAGAIVWHNDSMFETSGGFGPNQVSSVLGLGAAAAWLLIITNYQHINRILLAGLGLWFFTQAILTFSRGGVLTGLLAGVAGTLALAVWESQNLRYRVVFFSMTILLVLNYAVIPQLNTLTDGLMETRFTDTDTSHRNDIAISDLQIFLDRPFAGVGLGLAKQYRYVGAAAHTEYTRLLAEQGLFGLGIMIIWAYLLITQYQDKKADPMSLALVLFAAVWALVFMTHAALRIAAPGFFLGMVTFQRDSHPNESNEPA